MLTQLQNVDERVIQYATATDFCEIFTEEVHSLFLLSFLLTADKDKAEQCFIGALGECVEGIGAFMEWSRLWARRAIMKQAILMMRPVPEDTDHWSPMSVSEPATTTQMAFLRPFFHSVRLNDLSSFCRFSKDSQTQIAVVFYDARGGRSRLPASWL
jgi:hypothetical protein